MEKKETPPLLPSPQKKKEIVKCFLHWKGGRGHSGSKMREGKGQGGGGRGGGGGGGGRNCYCRDSQPVGSRQRGCRLVDGSQGGSTDRDRVVGGVTRWVAAVRPLRKKRLGTTALMCPVPGKTSASVGCISNSVSLSFFFCFSISSLSYAPVHPMLCLVQGCQVKEKDKKGSEEKMSLPFSLLFFLPTNF